MTDLRKDLTALRGPASVKNAFLASSPYVLRKIFAADPTIHRLIAAGDKVIPLVAAELHEAEHVDEIALAAFAYIVENVKAEAAPQIFERLFRKSVESPPGPFFVHFAAHALRSGLRLPIKPLEMVYTHAELIETQDMLH